MRNTVVLFFLFIGIGLHAQSTDFNTKKGKGYVVNGYDVVAYFSNEAVPGDDAFTATYEGSKFKFSSKENLEKFKANSKKYLPEYGGYCAYAVAVAGKKVAVNPKTFEIRNSKLYLFYNSGKNNTLESWLEKSPDDLVVKADKNWARIGKKE